MMNLLGEDEVKRRIYLAENYILNNIYNIINFPPEPTS